MYIIIMFLWKAIIWGDATIYFRSMSWWLFRGPDSKVPRKERAWAKGTPWIWLIWAQGVGKIKPAKMLIEKKNMEIKQHLEISLVFGRIHFSLKLSSASLPWHLHGPISCWEPRGGGNLNWTTGFIHRVWKINMLYGFEGQFNHQIGFRTKVLFTKFICERSSHTQQAVDFESVLVSVVHFWFLQFRHLYL